MKTEFENIRPSEPGMWVGCFINDQSAREFLNAGTSEGASKGWETRRHGAKAKDFPQAKQDANDASKAADEKDAEVPRTRQSKDDHFVLAEHHRVASELHAHAAMLAKDEGRKDDYTAHKTAADMHYSEEHAHARAALGQRAYEQKAQQLAAQKQPQQKGPPVYDPKTTAKAGDKESVKSGDQKSSPQPKSGNAKPTVEQQVWSKKPERPKSHAGFGTSRAPFGGVGGKKAAKKKPIKGKK